MSRSTALHGYLPGMMMPAMLIMAVALAGMSIVANLLVRDAVRAQIEGEIDADISGLMHDVRRYRIVGVIDAVDRRVMGATRLDDPAVYGVRFGGRIVAGNLNVWPAPHADVARKSFVFSAPDDRHSIPISAKIIHEAGGFDLLVGRRMQAYHRFEQRLVPLLVLAIIIVTLACSGLLFRQAARMAKRVEQVNEILTAAARGNYALRLAPPTTARDELAMLERGVDDMVERSEILVDNLRRLSEGMAHELKRPIADLLKMLRQKEGSSSSRDAVLEERLIDLLALFDALLELSEVRSGTGLPHGPIDLTTIALEASSLYGDVDPDREIQLVCRCERSAFMIGDHWLLLRAICNLVDNALRHSPAGGTVILSVATSGSSVTLEVADQGPGLGGRTLADAMRLARRTGHRGPNSHGLGLSMTEAITLRHGGSMAAREDHGLTVTIVFPSAAPRRTAT